MAVTLVTVLISLSSTLFSGPKSFESKTKTFLKLYSGNQYYIEYKPSHNSNFDLYFYEHEINEVTFSGIKFKVQNEGTYYFFARKGFKNGGIKIEEIPFPKNVLCQKIDNVKNIYEVDYKNLLNTTFDCIINQYLLEYPILEENSYFIFSLKTSSMFQLKLYNADNKEEKDDEYDNKNHDKQTKTNKKKYYILYSFLSLICFIVLVTICYCTEKGMHKIEEGNKYGYGCWHDFTYNCYKYHHKEFSEFEKNVKCCYESMNFLMYFGMINSISLTLYFFIYYFK